MSIRKFRPDIEALRAIAVTIVVINHAELALPGGFIGVDIFFVISGFLITKHLHDEVFKNGSLSLKSFYARRILRIFPASMLVLMLTLLGSFLFLSPLQLVNYCWDAILSAVSGINYRLAISGTDYFQSTTTPSPFQHFWSLAVEEQFYLIWPLLILVLARLLIKNKNKPLQIPEAISDPLIELRLKAQNKKLEFIKQKEFTKFTQATTVLLSIIIAVSLFLSYKISGESQMWAYFGLHTRAWQLAIGGIIAFNLPLLSKIPSRISSVLSWIGFTGVITSLILINKTTVYPGLWALLPTLATALIVIAGTHKTKFSFESFFDYAVVRWIGKVSYSLYLIHWPIFVFIFYQLGENIRVTDRIAAIMISLMIAALSLFLIENPVRFNNQLKRSFRLTYQVGLILILLVSGTSYAVEFAKVRISSNAKVALAAANKSEADVFNKLQEAVVLKELPTKLSKPLEQVAKETGSSCIAVETIATPAEGAKCKLGDKTAKQTIVLLGDSHANQWTKAFDFIAQKNNYQLIPFAKSGCSMTNIKHFNPLLKRDYTECYSYRNAVMEEIAKIKPDIVVTTELVYQSSTTESYTAFLQKLQSMSNQVIRLTDTPRPTQNIPECLAKNSTDITKCGFSIENGNNNGGPEKEKENKIAADLGATVIDTTNWFCLDKVCPAVSDNIIVYNDDSHVSDSYTKYLEDLLDTQLFKTADEYAKSITAATKLTNLPTNLVLPLEQAAKDNFRSGACIAQAAEAEPTNQSSCTLGDVNGSKLMVLTGDSHAHQWTQAASDIASKNGYKLITLTKSGCPMSDITANNFLLNRDFTECYSWRKAALAQIEKLNPDLVITSSLTYSNSEASKYSDYLRQLKAISKKVVRLEDTPHPTKNIPECLAKNSSNIQLCNLNIIKTTLNFNQREAETKAAKEAGVNVVDISQWFCNGQTCPTVIDNIVVYHDDSHISNTYSKHLGDLLEDKIFNDEDPLAKNIVQALSTKELPKKLVTPLEGVFADRSKIPCISDNVESELPDINKCLTKNSKDNKLMVLIGDSHAYQWVEAMDKVAKDNNYDYLILNKYGCPLQDIKTINVTIKRDYTECYTWRDKLFSKLTELKPDLVVTANLTYAESSTEKQKVYIQKLKVISKKVVVLEDTPFPGTNIPECLAKNLQNIQKCTFSLKNADKNTLKQINDELEVARKVPVSVVNTKDLFCHNESCPAIIDNIVVWQDDSHFTNTYSKHISSQLGEKLFGQNKVTSNSTPSKLKAALKLTNLPSSLKVPLDQAAKDYNYKCKDEWLITTPSEENKCILGDKNSTKTIAVIGDSHAQQWLLPLDTIATKYGYKIITRTKAACPIVDLDIFEKSYLKRSYPECNAWRKEVLAQMEAIKPDVIISSEEIYEESTPQKYEDYIKKLQTITKNVVKIIDTPRAGLEVPECLAKNSANIQKCNFSYAKGLFNKAQADKESEINKTLGVNVVDTASWFCVDGMCPVVIDNTIVYIDSNHVSSSYSKYLTESLDQKLKVTLTK
jgi:peptidoglycan/LPS O-acetylase OafA/YrhL/ABC-type Fe3+-hydroxamate transport system substrate-binding protein